jgi:hypothetical protein
MMQGLLKLSVVDMEAMDKMRAGKNEFVTLDPSLVTAIKKATREWSAKMAGEQKAKGNPWMEKFASSYFEFQDKWGRAAEIRVTD